MSRWLEAWHRYRRQNRFVIGAFVFLLLLSLGAVYLLQRTQEASPRELTNRLLLFVLWYLDVSLILVLSFILVRSVVRLVFERRGGVIGSRFRTKLVLTYVGLTFVPVIFIFLIATNLLQRSIDHWFSSPVEEILRGGAAVTVELRELVEERLVRQAAVAAKAVSRQERRADLGALRETMGVDLVALYRGPLLVEAISDPRRIQGSAPPLRRNQLASSGVRAQRWRGSLLIRAWATVEGEMTIVVGDLLPRELLLHLERATAADATFQEMKIERKTVTATTILVFLAVTLLLLFATVWVGLYLSRRFTEPLLAVVEATRRVAEGNRLEEVAVEATDEVGALVDSFNAMVRRVRATEAEILASNQELATLLATIPTGVVTISGDSAHVRLNPAAERLLGIPESGGRWIAAKALNRPGLETLLELLEPESADEARLELDLEPEGGIRHVEVTIRPLPDGGRVVAIDDLSQLVRAQRQAAWSEVARHIAHEIMNPLTPIRLAAERIERRAERLDEEQRAVIRSGCEAIIAHVAGLKELVDAFHQYARMPLVSPRAASVNQLLSEVVSLYQGLRPGLEVRLDRPASDIQASFDPVLLRQALVNLIDNAVEAIADQGSIGVAARTANGDLVIEVADDGAGLPTEEHALLTQPFYSTKGRGSGMGLALVHRIASDHGGRLELERRQPTGTVARVVLTAAVLAPVEA